MSSSSSPLADECYICLDADPPSSSSPASSKKPSRASLLRPCSCNAHVHWECWRRAVGAAAEESGDDEEAGVVRALACAVCRRVPSPAEVRARALVVRVDAAMLGLLGSSALVVMCGTALLVDQAARGDLPSRAANASLAMMLAVSSAFSLLLWRAHCVHYGRVACWTCSVETTRSRAGGR